MAVMAEGAPAPVLVEDEVRPLPLRSVMVAALLSSSGAAWMVGGLYRDFTPRLICLLAAAVGVGWIGLSYRLQRPQLLQSLLVPVIVLLAAVIALPAAAGATLPDSVIAAVNNGGLLQPPIAFDAGWRFIAVTLVGLLAAATALLAASGSRARLSLMLPLPITAAAALVQPPGSELLGGGFALVAVVGSLLVLSGAEISSSTQVSRTFEARRIGRGAGAVALLMVALAVASRSNLLFPEPVRSRVAEPQRPRVVALNQVKDRALFTVHTDLKGPWREGVLDVYRDNAFLLPPYDPSTFKEVSSGTNLGNSSGTERVVKVTVDSATGHVLPNLAGTVQVKTPVRLTYDPRGQILNLPDQVAGPGFEYTLVARPAPTGEEMTRSGAPPASLRAFLEAPAPPEAVRTLLAAAPTNRWERLQYVRTHFYDKVVAAGSGRPVDVPASRVAQMLAGGEGSPYEITAAEVLLARWAGIPARLGFGFYGGASVSGGFELHPKDGANWLEVYFDGFGWVPIFGVPPQARATLTQSEKNRNVEVRPSKDISAEIYVPLSLDSPIFFYEFARYYLVVALPFVLAAVLLVAFFPYPIKLWRTNRRRRWAAERGFAARIAVAYAGFRDAATDLNAGSPFDTPLEFLDRVEPDDEHAELAWLTTRALWGDLARDLREDDAAAAEALGRSVRRRLARAQTPVTRILAFGSRASLRQPYDSSLPNPWPAPKPALATARA